MAIAFVLGGSGMSDPRHFPTYIPTIKRWYLPLVPGTPAVRSIIPVVAPNELAPLLGTRTFDESRIAGTAALASVVDEWTTQHPAETVVVAGLSQGAAIATSHKRAMASDPALPSIRTGFLLLSNVNRPNGGILSRFPRLRIPFLGITFDGPTPTDTAYPTVDVALQYDGFADFPRYPLNVLATANALLGMLYVHGSEFSLTFAIGSGMTSDGSHFCSVPDGFEAALNHPANRQVHGDTTYITVPTAHLPILEPLRELGTLTGSQALTRPLADLLEPALRAVIEAGYDRRSYGRAVGAGIVPARYFVGEMQEFVATARSTAEAVLRGRRRS